MSDQRRWMTYQGWVQRSACDSNIQPYMRWKTGIPQDAIDQTFTTPDALALMSLRKEGDHYVRN
jgi:hypothetical protein